MEARYTPLIANAHGLFEFGYLLVVMDGTRPGCPRSIFIKARSPDVRPRQMFAILEVFMGKVDGDQDAVSRSGFHKRGMYLSSKEAAYYLGLSVRTLEGLRYRKQGPRCYKRGRGWFYHLAEIEIWASKVSRGVV
jgi:hypothetical protein